MHKVARRRAKAYHRLVGEQYEEHVKARASAMRTCSTPEKRSTAKSTADKSAEKISPRRSQRTRRHQVSADKAAEEELDEILGPEDDNIQRRQHHPIYEIGEPFHPETKPRLEEEEDVA